ncbi:hypothetical protein A0H81_00727 [Grifola frondosa]|uniref:Uncharacterized protein n=1 Tax=Grifola frondosa TaxID=5627 RepID=A0A1C7MTV7_GRIFR|nr:hypothetical protein A0H81_00727 [Grifola frondosa]
MATHITTLTEAVATEVVATQVFTSNEESMAAKTHPAFASPDADVALCSKETLLSAYIRTLFRRGREYHRGPPCTGGRRRARRAPSHRERNRLPGPEEYPLPRVAPVRRREIRDALPIAIARVALMSPVVNASPIRVYGIACRMNWIPEAKLASTRTLMLDLFAPGWVAELDRVDAPHLTKLVALHRQRKDASSRHSTVPRSSPTIGPLSASTAGASGAPRVAEPEVSMGEANG